MELHSDRLRLQRRAGRNLRAHWVRDATRVTVLVASDVFTYVAIAAAIIWIRMGGLGALPADVASFAYPNGTFLQPQLPGALLLSLLIVGGYGAGDLRRDTGRIFAAAALTGVIFLYQALWVETWWHVAVRFAGVVALLGLALSVSRWTVDELVRRFRSPGAAARTVLVAHGDQNWPELQRMLLNPREFALVGSMHLTNAEGGLNRQSNRLAELIDRSDADTVLIWGDLSEDEFQTAVDLALASGCRLLAGPRHSKTAGVEPKGVWIEDTPLVELTAPHFSAWQLAVKRSVDVLAAGIGLLLLSPLLLPVALGIKLTSPGPVFFRQWRVGQGGRLFRIYKFRSMVADAEARRSTLDDESIYRDPRLFKVVADPRVTPLGRWLRQTSVDELPQLINVLVGDMSLVGPRPPLPSEAQHYEEHHFCRFDVRPGITGPWQVGGRNQITDFEKVIELERRYIRNWNLMRDVAILFKTVPVVLRGSGAH